MDHPAISALVGWTRVMNDLRQRTYSAARTELRVLILGERGTGKELIAAAVHESSNRAAAEFIPVNCTAVPRELFESEMFGYVRGAFTGALRDKRGKFELAHRGTLFLDEIGDLSYENQGKLLRAIDSGCIDKVGAEKPLRVDVRMVAATNRNLEMMVENGTFRADLYDRLNMYSLRTPRLRDRRGDIPVLLQHFVRVHSEPRGRLVRGFSAQLVELFQKYSWPGNVRELESVARYLIETVDDEIADC